jgi:Flp pilus assembly protein TadB
MTTLRKLGLRGVRSYSQSEEESIEFLKPLTIIVGANGAGRKKRREEKRREEKKRKEKKRKRKEKEKKRRKKRKNNKEKQFEGCKGSRGRSASRCIAHFHLRSYFALFLLHAGKTVRSKAHAFSTAASGLIVCSFFLLLCFCLFFFFFFRVSSKA